MSRISWGLGHPRSLVAHCAGCGDSRDAHSRNLGNMGGKRTTCSGLNVGSLPERYADELYRMGSLDA